MRRLGLALLFVLTLAPGLLRAQTTTPAELTLRAQADQLLAQCASVPTIPKFSPDLPSLPPRCFAWHVGAGVEAIKHQKWDQAVAEETAAITLFVTHRKDIFGSLPYQIPDIVGNNTAAYLDRAIAYHKLKQYDLAIADNTMVIALDPTNAHALNNRCWYRAITGDLNEALQDCERSRALNPYQAHALDSTGFVYLKMKNYPAALDYYEAALRIPPKTASSLYGLGLAEEAEGQQAQGAQDLAAAQQIDANITRDFGT